ncbi:MAG: adenylate cyclase [Chthoniobacterales bacterium]|nr:adenylate cyclase [Chthoniobacterales bacterium]
MKQPHLEIERKFLVEKLPRSLRQYPHKEIAQGYLVADRSKGHVRVRRAGRTCTLTFKRGPARFREEREIPLTPAQFAVLWPATAGSRLTKTRYYVPFKKLTVEIDIYRGSNEGLMVAEVEFPDPETYHSFRPPTWLGDEVTGANRYSNVKLARD